MLPARFQEPSGFQWNSFIDASGASIRYGSLSPVAPPRGTIVVASGFRECIEKYFEVMRDMTERGFAVWMMDWHGQGGSRRYLANPQKMHSLGYDEHIETLRRFASDIVKPASGPLVLMAHSMGGHIGLRLLKEHKGVFNAAILTSPMCDILTPGFVKPLARGLAAFAKTMGWLEKYVPGGHDWREEDASFPRNSLTGDPERFSVMPALFRQKPSLRMGSPTYGWAWHTFRTISVLNADGYADSIDIPVLAGLAGDERVVDRAAAARICGRLYSCKRVDIPRARHEIWMEKDDLRSLWLSEVDAFLTEQVENYRQSAIPTAS